MIWPLVNNIYWIISSIVICFSLIGGVGKWTSYFSEAQSENLDRVMEETFKDCPGLEFVYELQ